MYQFEPDLILAFFKVNFLQSSRGYEFVIYRHLLCREKLNIPVPVRIRFECLRGIGTLFCVRLGRFVDRRRRLHL